MSVAQVKLIIEAICPGKFISRRKRNEVDGEYDLILGNIPFTRSKMYIVAIITDINDNPPIWDAKIPKMIGYPSKDLTKFVQIPKVYTLSVSKILKIILYQTRYYKIFSRNCFWTFLSQIYNM